MFFYRERERERKKPATYRPPRIRRRLTTDESRAEISGIRARRIGDTAGEDAGIRRQDGDVCLRPIGVVEDLPIANAEELEEGRERDGHVWRRVRVEVDGEGDGAGAAAAAVDGDVLVQNGVLGGGGCVWLGLGGRWLHGCW